jgi:hypothetical protein
MNQNEKNFIEDFMKSVEEGRIKPTEENFIPFGLDPKYELSSEKVSNLWVEYPELCYEHQLSSRMVQSDWDDPVTTIKRFCKKPVAKTICVLSVDFNERPMKELRNIQINDKLSSSNYWFLENIGFYRIINVDTGNDDPDIDSHYKWQFPETVYRAVGAVFKRRIKRKKSKNTGYILVYRKTARITRAKEITKKEVAFCKKETKDNILNTFFKEEIKGPITSLNSG